MKAVLTFIGAWVLLCMVYTAVVLVRIAPMGWGEPVTDPFVTATLPWFVGVNGALVFIVLPAAIIAMLVEVWRR